MYSGSYSTDFFAQFQSWVNYGGTCNTLWGAYRPAGWVTVQASRYNGAVRIQLDTRTNAYNESATTASVPHSASDTAYLAYVSVYDGSRTFYLSKCFGACGT